MTVTVTDRTPTGQNRRGAFKGAAGDMDMATVSVTSDISSYVQADGIPCRGEFVTQFGMKHVEMACVSMVQTDDAAALVAAGARYRADTQSIHLYESGVGASSPQEMPAGTDISAVEVDMIIWGN